MRAVVPAIGIAVAIGAAVLLFGVGPGPAPVTPAPAGAPVPAPAPATAATPGRRDSGGDARLGRRDLAPEERTAARLIGRVVDERGTALAGAVVAVRWSGAGLDAIAGVRPESDPPATVSRPDGSFEFELGLDPPADRPLLLAVEAVGRIPVNASWSTVPPGQQVDAGDVVLRRGITLRGTVVDQADRPLSGVSLRLTTSSHPRSGDGVATPRAYATATSAPDGTFALPSALAPGRWTCFADRFEQTSPAEFIIAADERERDVRIELHVPGPDQRIRGVVVDETGLPIAGATVFHDPASARQRAPATDALGAFEIVRGLNTADVDPAVRVEKRGYEPTEPARLSWGEHAARITMRRGLDVEVRIADDRGSPVEEFGLRLIWADGPAVTSIPSDPRLRASGRHLGGRCVLESVRRGRYALIVVPVAAGLCSSAAIPVSVHDGMPAVEAVLGPSITEHLLVRGDDGRPVAGARIELLSPLDEREIDAATHAGTPHELAAAPTVPRALLIDAATADPAGNASLAGPRGARLALRIGGEGYGTVVIGDVELGRGVREVVLPALAAIRGSVGPRALVEQLLDEAALDERAAPSHPRWPMLRFHRLVPEGAMTPSVALARDGTFSASLAPGTWAIDLIATHVTAPGRTRVAPFRLGKITVSPTRASRPIELDASGLLRSTLRGQILLNGRPLSGRRVSLVPVGGLDPRTTHVETDDLGRFTARVRPALITVRAVVDPPGPVQTRLSATPAVRIEPGEDAEARLSISTTRLELRVLGSHGEPVEGVRLSLSRSDEAVEMSMPPTDALGLTRSDLAPIGEFRLRVHPRRLLDPGERARFLRENAGDPGAWPRAMLDLGGVAVTARPAPSPRLVTLPAASGY